MDRPIPDLLPNLAMASAALALEEHFAGAACAFVAGSIMRGQGTTGSDVDLVVLFPILEQAWRQSFTFGGFPVEAFVQDPSTLEHYFEQDIASGRPVIISMVAQGRLVGHDIACGRRCQERARSLLSAGPSRVIDSTLLYAVSDLAEDLRGQRPADEIRAIAVHLYPKLADLMLVGRGHWSGTGKWVPRRLRDLGEDLAAAFDAAMAEGFAGRGESLLALCDAELARHGGPFFDGFKAMGAKSRQG